MTRLITVIGGDGIGPEIAGEAVKTLDTVSELFGIDFQYKYAKMGGAAFDEATSSMSAQEIKAIDDWSDEDKRKLTFPEASLNAMCEARDNNGAVLFGSVGRPDLPKRVAELALLYMRKFFSVVNNRPFIIDPILAHNSILYRDPVTVSGFEVASPESSLFNGETNTTDNESWTRKGYSKADLEKFLINTLERAIQEDKQVICASKYNVLISEKMLSDSFEEVASRYNGKLRFNTSANWIKNPNGTLRFASAYDTQTQLQMIKTLQTPTGELIIDNAGMQIAKNPEAYSNTIVIADAMFGGFLNAIVDVVSGSKAVNQDCLEQIKTEGIQRTFIRELCGGLYFGQRDSNAEMAYDTLHYDRKTLEDLATVANKVNQQMGTPYVDSLEVTGVPTFEFWANVLNGHAYQNNYKVRHHDIKTSVEMLLTDPASLGTVIASNMMGDIYTDLAAAVVGKSLGIMPSSAVNADGFGIYEQIAGSAPDIAGKGIANPIAEIRSAAMMLNDMGYYDASALVNRAITNALGKVRTPDIWEEGFKKVGTEEMGKAIRYEMKELRRVA